MTDRRRQSTLEAADWWTALHEAGLRRRDRERFVDWLQASPENVAEYLEMADAWHDLGGVGAEADVEAILAQAADADNVVFLQPPGPAEPRPNRWFRRQPVWLAAVAVAVVATLSVLIPQDGLMHTAVGEQRSATLRDGSVVTLNTRTKIDIRFDGATRRVDLVAGEALFDVVADRRPFVVVVGSTEVRALGTRFNVYRLDDAEAMVTVLVGKVAVRAPGLGGGPTSPSTAAHGSAGFELTGGQQLHLRSDDTATAVRDVSPERAAEWTARRITFENTALEDVVAQFNRYSDDRLRVADPELAALKLNGVFGTEGQDDLLEFLRKTEDIHVRRVGNERVITR